MGIITKKIEIHWNYLIAIEQDLFNLSRYIEFHRDNFKCFSIEISRILMASSAEIDVVCKQICKNINANSKAEKIGQYKDEILKAYKDIPGFQVQLPRYGLELTPWINWANENDISPFWWTANNKIKHQRHTHFSKGNLKNALNAVAGLFVMVLYLYKQKAEEGELLPPAKILSVTDDNCRGTVFRDGEFAFYYVLK